MAFEVETYTSEDQLAAALQADVSTHSSEDELAAAIETILDPNDILTVLAKGGFFTLISSPGIAFTSLRVLAKGGFFTVILET